MSPPPAQPEFQAAPPPIAPRKTSPLVWLLVIVLGLFVLAGISVAGFTLFVVHKVKEAGIDPDLWRRNPGVAVGRMLAATNPNLEVVRTDDGAGTITLRDRRNGKETTITFDDARSGRFSVRTQDDRGKMANLEFGAVAGKPPAWVPDYPGSNPTYSLRGSSEGGDEGGNFTFTTSDSASKVFAFYQEKVHEAEMETKVSATSEDGGTLVASRDGDARTLTIVVGGGRSSRTTVNVTYSRKR
jgi:hypothetical protein